MMLATFGKNNPYKCDSLRGQINYNDIKYTDILNGNICKGVTTIAFHRSVFIPLLAAGDSLTSVQDMVVKICRILVVSLVR